MDGKIHDLIMTRDGDAILSLRFPRGIGTAAFFDKLIQLKDETVTVDIKKKRAKRSLDANAYAWVLINNIAEKTRVSVADVYRNAIRNVGGNNTVVCVQDKAVYALQEAWAHNGLGWISDTIPSKIDGCTNVILYAGSSTYDSATMSRMIDNIVQDAKALDIDTLPPHELESLLNNFAAKDNK